MRKILIIFIFIFIISSLFTQVLAYYEVELFNDPKFENGVAVGYPNTYPDEEDEKCINRWKQVLPSYDNIKWMFGEISERFYFCEPDETSPGVPIVEPNKIEYFGPNWGRNDIKVFTSNRNGTVRMKFDTSWEWRGGCNLSLPWDINNPALQPKYGNPLHNWPHFFITQYFSSTYKPSPYFNLFHIPPEERIRLNKYDQLQFSGQFRLNKIEKKGEECPAGDWNGETFPNHAIFYISFVLLRDNPNSSGPNIIYQLLPIVYTEDGIVNSSKLLSNKLLYDPLGDAVYFAELGKDVTANVKHLTEGSPNFETITIDAAEFSHQILDILKEKYPNLNYDDYFFASFIGGWEIWGGYQTDIEIRNLSLKGINFSSNCFCQSDNCNINCTFDKYNDISYNNPIKCSLSSSFFSSSPSSGDKTSWCQRSLRTKGDADGNGVVNNLDYFYYVGVVADGKIPLTVNPDFNGDGEIGAADRAIIVKTLNL